MYIIQQSQPIEVARHIHPLLHINVPSPLFRHVLFLVITKTRFFFKQKQNRQPYKNCINCIRYLNVNIDSVLTIFIRSSTSRDCAIPMDMSSATHTWQSRDIHTWRSRMSSTTGGLELVFSTFNQAARDWWHVLGRAHISSKRHVDTPTSRHQEYKSRNSPQRRRPTRGLHILICNKYYDSPSASSLRSVIEFSRKAYTQFSPGPQIQLKYCIVRAIETNRPTRVDDTSYFSSTKAEFVFCIQSQLTKVRRKLQPYVAHPLTTGYKLN